MQLAVTLRAVKSSTGFAHRWIKPNKQKRVVFLLARIKITKQQSEILGLALMPVQLKILKTGHFTLGKYHKTWPFAPQTTRYAKQLDCLTTFAGDWQNKTVS